MRALIFVVSSILFVSSSMAQHHHTHPGNNTPAPHHHDCTVHSIETKSWSTPPSIQINVFKDKMKGYNLQLLTKNFEFDPANAGGAHQDGFGHAHLYINGKKITRLYGEWYYIADLIPGMNTVRVSLNSNDHTCYSFDSKPIEAATIVRH